MKTFYDKYIMPKVVAASCGSRLVGMQRQKIVPQAEGVVVEVGIGPGHNLRFYDSDKVTRVIGVDPVQEMTDLARQRLQQSPIEVEIISASGEKLPMEDKSVDSVVLTYTACTIPDVAKALGEMRRVLKPGGQLLFAEHGRSPEPHIARWQDRLDGVWGRFSGGCHINRDIAALLEDAGFAFTQLDRGYLLNYFKVSTYHFRGRAEPR